MPLYEYHIVDFEAISYLPHDFYHFLPPLGRKRPAIGGAVAVWDVSATQGMIKRRARTQPNGSDTQPALSADPLASRPWALG